MLSSTRIASSAGARSQREDFIVGKLLVPGAQRKHRDADEIEQNGGTYIMLLVQ